MKTKLLSLLVFVMIISKLINAAEVDSIVVKKVAENYFYEAYAFGKSVPIESLKATIKDVVRSSDSKPLLYFVNVQPTGYLIISGDDRAYPVLSYSTSESWSDDSWELMPPAAIDFINGYAEQMELIVGLNFVADQGITALWEKYSNPDKLEPENTRLSNGLEAMGNLKWSQSKYYNRQCPQTGGVHPNHLTNPDYYDFRTPAGCVAIAMAQIMRYWSWPNVGVDSKSYNDPANSVGNSCVLADPSYGQQTANFGNTTYNWNNMPNSLNDFNDDVSLIIRQCGVAVNMDYSYCGSGSNIINARYALVNNFRFSPDATIHSKDATIDWLEWEGIIKAEINAKRPVQFHASSSSGGRHALVVWDYEASDSYYKFKFNWGWAGQNNTTWYTIRNVAGDGLIDYNIDQEIITGLFPNNPNLSFQPCPGMPTINYEGETYNTLKLGDQCWMKENLNIGAMLQSNQNSSNNGVIEKYCYNNDQANCQTYGGLYSWDEMMQYTTEEGVKGICPDGWHLSSDEELNTLSGFVDSQYPVGDPIWQTIGSRGSDAGGKMKSLGTELWTSPNTGATNESGFAALPGGTWNNYTGYNGLKNFAYFWTSTQTNQNSGLYHRLDYNDKRIYHNIRLKGYRLSVRCLREALPGNILVSLNGIVNDATSGTGIYNSQVLLTGYNQSYSAFTQQNGSYSINLIEPGTYNLNVSKEGYYTFNQNIQISDQQTQTFNIILTPNNSDLLVINSMLTAYADNIVENPSNFFALTGNVNINNILYFDGNVVIDKRPYLSYPEISGNCGFFTTNIANQPVYWIKNNNIPIKYYALENRLIPLSLAYIVDGTFCIGGFNITIGELILDEYEDYVEVKSIARMPFPVDMIVDSLLEKYKDDIPFFVKEMSGSRILSKTNGEQTAVDIDGITVNIGLVSLEDVHLYFNTNTQTYGGGFKLNIPGNLKKPKSETDSLFLNNEFDHLQVEIRNENDQIIDSLSFNEFLEDYSEREFKLLSVGAEIEFVQGAINKIIVSIGTKVPIGTTGLFLTEIKGGLEDLATKNWKVIANVDIELGVDVPVLGSPVKFNDFGVKIQPFDEFMGSGEFKIFDQTVSEGSVTFISSKKSLSAESNLNLIGLLTGKSYLNLVGGHINGSSLMTLQTPSDLPWFLNWAQNKKLGSALAEINNQYYQAEVKLGWINFAQKMEFGKQGFPWFHYYLGRNFSNLYQIWKGTKDGKLALTFQVPENTGQLLVVAMDTINPTLFDFTLQSPSGELFSQENAHYYEKNPTSQQTIMSLIQPLDGDWIFLSAYEGDIALHTTGVDQKPAAITVQPSSKRTRNNEISLIFNDYKDTVQVQVYYNTYNKRFDGSFIDEFTLVNNATLNFTWQNDDVPNGEYYIYSRIDDGKNAPVLQYAPGSIWVENEPSIETPQNLQAIQQADSVIVTWNKAQQSNTYATTVYFKNISTGRTEQQAVLDDNNVTLRDFVPGKGYEIWCRFIDDEGTYSPKSNVVNIVFTSSTRNNPPYFTLDRDSAFVFIAEKAAQYTLLANDADGDVLTFTAPGDTLGFAIAGNQLTWSPSEEQKGIYQLMLIVTDGSDNDTTYLQLIVYTSEQVETSLAFNSVRLYEADNTFIILRNFFSEDPIQTISLTNLRTLEQVDIACRRINEFEYMGQFYLSFQNRSEITVANGDSIRASYHWNNQDFSAFACFDSNPQPTDQTPPGIINDLISERLENNQVILKWTATGNNFEEGKAYKYDIRFAFEPITSEDVYFTAYLVDNAPYPSVSGIQDSLIVNLATLQGVMGHDMIFFAIKAEDEMQNRGNLSNSPGVNCLLDPANITAIVQEVYKMNINWEGPEAGNRAESGFEHYELYKQLNQGGFIMVESWLTQPRYVDDLKNSPDGIYQYGIKAVYETGESDTIQSNPVALKRFVNVNILCTLEDSTDCSGIQFSMSSLDTLYGQTFSRTTNLTGLILLADVFKSDYKIEILKEGFGTINDSILVAENQTAFNYMLLNTSKSQVIPITTGWSGLSSYVNPYEDNVESLFLPILSDLIILQSETGMYWPGQNINTFGTWNTHEGYQIKVADSVELSISGVRENNKNLQLATGWNLIPVLSECEVDVATLFAGKDLIIAKQVAGWQLYWPTMGINTLGSFWPGKAYLVMMGSNGTVQFPECTNKSSGKVFGNLPGLSDLEILCPASWQRITQTAITHTIAIQADATKSFNSGDIIGAFDEHGNCFGLINWQNENTAITIFGNDPTTSIKDGFNENEPMQFSLLRQGSNAELLLKVVFDKSLPNPDPVFNANGLSAISTVEVEESGILLKPLDKLIQIIPNPAKHEFRILIEDSAFTNGLLTISTFDSRIVKSAELKDKISTIPINELKCGVYVLQIQYGNLTIIKRLIKI
jgi:uncharacterized protein (TIGR02145 family)